VRKWRPLTGLIKLTGLSPEAMVEVVRFASVGSFQSVAIIPVLLLPVFAVIWFCRVQTKQRRSGWSKPLRDGYSIVDARV